MTNRRPLVLLGAAVLLTAAVAQHPSAQIEILTHDATDHAPHRISAAVDFGVMAVSVLVTWTSKRLIHG